MDRKKHMTLSDAAPLLQRMSAAFSDQEYQPQTGVKIIKITCPLDYREKVIHQPYYFFEGRCLPERNNGCDDLHQCRECDLCRLSVMEQVLNSTDLD